MVDSVGSRSMIDCLWLMRLPSSFIPCYVYEACVDHCIRRLRQMWKRDRPNTVQQYPTPFNSTQHRSAVPNTVQQYPTPFNSTQHRSTGLLYPSPLPRDLPASRMPSPAFKNNLHHLPPPLLYLTLLLIPSSPPHQPY